MYWIHLYIIFLSNKLVKWFSVFNKQYIGVFCFIILYYLPPPPTHNHWLIFVKIFFYFYSFLSIYVVFIMTWCLPLSFLLSVIWISLHQANMDSERLFQLLAYVLKCVERLSTINFFHALASWRLSEISI